MAELVPYESAPYWPSQRAGWLQKLAREKGWSLDPGAASLLAEWIEDEEELRSAISDSIRKKDADLKGSMASQGTTPRQLTDLIGSLCDLTSGSGDKGTPVVLVQGYFDNYTND